ncbi:MAG: hypothetical protein IJ419_01765 [Agathobacter sp.]|nr:hypothetical protein [Agathobacter sp.]
MKEQEKISTYRLLSCIAILVSAIIASSILCIINGLQFDEIFCVIVVILGVMPVVFFEMAFERRRNMISNNIQTSFERIAVGFFLCCVFMLVISFMPEFFRPVMLFPLIMVAFSNESIGIMTGLFLNILLAMTTGGSFHELLAYILLVIIGGVLTKALQQQEYRIMIGALLLCSNVLFPSVFCYWTNESVTPAQLGYALLNGILTALYAIFIYPKNKLKTEQEIAYHYESILADDYSQVREIKNYSLAEYRHARKVSDIAYKYAVALGLKADLTAAAGFYYRLGRLEGDPVVENGVKKANELCFPAELVQILKEYNGEKNLPSTPESALIHIIDGVLIKVELLNKQVGTSQWNREVLIHQTLNEFSTAGLYDKSGLSINAFIKIRELLAKEELLS